MEIWSASLSSIEMAMPLIQKKISEGFTSGIEGDVGWDLRKPDEYYRAEKPINSDKVVCPQDLKAECVVCGGRGTFQGESCSRCKGTGFVGGKNEKV